LADISNGIKILYNKDFLTPFKETLVWYDLGQKASYNLAQGAGGTVEWTRFLKLPEITSKLTESDPGSSDAWKVDIIQASPEEWGNYVLVSSHYKFVTIDKKLRELSALLGDQGARSLELQFIKQWSLYGSIPMRSDGDPAYEKHGVAVTDVADSTSITTSLTDANDYWNLGRVCFTNPTDGCYGTSRDISDFASSGGDITVGTALLNYASASSSGTVSIATPAGLDSTKIMTLQAGKRAVRMLRKQDVPTYKGGYYQAVTDDDVLYDLSNDEYWKELQANHASSPQEVFKGEVGRFWGAVYKRSSKSFKCAPSTGTTYSDTGTVHSVGFFGKNCMGVIDCAGQGMHIVYGSADRVDPYLNMASSIGWKIMWQVKALNAAASVQMFTGVSV